MKNLGITFIMVFLLHGVAFGQSDCDVWLGTWDVTYNDESTYVWVIDEIVTGVSANIRCQALGTSTPTEGGESFPFQIIFVTFSPDFIYSEDLEAGQEMGKHVVVLNASGDAFESGTGFTDYDIAYGTKRGVTGPRCNAVTPKFVFGGDEGIELTIIGTETGFDSELTEVTFACPEVEVVDTSIVSESELVVTVNVAANAQTTDCDVMVTTGEEEITCNFEVREYIPTERLVWKFETGGYINSSPAVSDNKVYFGSTDNKVYCLDAQSGSKIWEYETGNMVSSSPLVVDSNLYIGSNDGKLYCLDALTGAKIWDFETGDGVNSSAALYEGNLYFGSFDNKVYCIDAQTGDKKWDYETQADVFSTPAVVDGTVYVGGVDYALYCLDAETGTLNWSYATEGDIPPSPAVGGGRVYFGSRDHSFYCVDASTGQKVWSYETGAVVYSSPVLAGKYVYFGSLDNNVYSLNAKTGELNYVFYTGSVVHASPAVTGDYVYIGSGDTYMYCLDAENGKKHWESKTGGSVSSAPAIVNGYVYFGSYDGYFYCLNAADDDTGSWPMFRNNPQRTGVAESSQCLVTQMFGKNDQRLQTLRKFRDTMLAKNFIGEKLISMYYAYDDRVLSLCRKYPIAEKATIKLIGALMLVASLVVE